MSNINNIKNLEINEFQNSELNCQQNQENSTGCYITTVMCGVLGYSDQCFVLNEMRNFRNEVMQKDPRYFDMLLEYDIVGPIIAKDIEDEYKTTQDKNMWTNFYKLFLSETANLVASKKYDEAVQKYQKMMESLKDYFGIRDIDLTCYRQGYDMKNGGHGRFKMILPPSKMVTQM